MAGGTVLNGRGRYAATARPAIDYAMPDFGAPWAPEVTLLPNGWGVSIATVGPGLAAAMLATNREDNRSRRRHTTARYAGDMRGGLWQLTHQGIAFDRRGRLCDGQHRLTACADSGAPFASLVFFGVGNNEEMAVLDTGANRSAADASTYVLGERVGNDVIAVARSFAHGPNRFRVTMTHAHLLGLIDTYRAGIWFYRRAFHAGDKRYAPAPVRGAVVRAFYHADPDDLTRFVAVLAERLDPSEPRDRVIKQLRRIVVDGTTGNGLDRQRELYCKAQRAVAAYLGGEVIDRLFASEDDLFPLPSESQLADRDALADADPATPTEG